MLARMCGIDDPDAFIVNVVAVPGEDSAGSSLMLLSAFASLASTKFAPSPTTTTTTTTTIDYTGAMKTLRHRTSTLVPPPRTLLTRAAFDDIVEIMDEIQEVMDTAKEMESGLRSLGEMKAKEMRKRNGRATTTTTTTTNDGNNVGGAVTTIGFGITGATGNDALVGGGTTVLFADATAAATTIPPTMMIVKKKKKPMQQQQQQQPSSGK